ncbi:solute carrier organic anion transporter family member 74D-like isoform X2 [Tachypleus tridentatus]|uniref:solute carrier organic anion transporter family member 74D-like isoform X2 n=1 Tax=Tachypleus tridentatus TaxID=6853 RepID=UPI003FD62A55
MYRNTSRSIDDESMIPMNPNGNESKAAILFNNHKASNGNENNRKPLAVVNENAFVPNERYADNIATPYCGLGSFRPKWLQTLANKKTFLAIFCLTSILQGMYSTYFVSVLTTIEKLYRVESKTTGIILSATEIGQIGGAFFLTYYGGHGHRPRWIAFGTLLFATACLFCSTPHFLFRVDYLPDTDQDRSDNMTYQTLYELRADLCHGGLVASRGDSRIQTDAWESVIDSGKENTTLLSQGQNAIWRRDSMTNRSFNYVPTPESYWYDNISESSFPDVPSSSSQTTGFVLAIFFISLLFIGIGATAVYTLGIPYIDDNVATRDSPMYFETAKHLTPDDPQWVGAWWLGLCMVGATLFLTVIPMASFPRKLSQSISSPQRQVAHVHLNGQMKGKTCNNNQQEKALLGKHNWKKTNTSKSFPQAMRRLLQNEVLLCRTASSVLHIMPVAGLYTFLPKYLETQFQLNPTKANIISGMAGILVMGVGIFFSGTLMRRFKPRARIVATWITLATFAYCLGMVILMWIGCPVNIKVGLDDTRSNMASSVDNICNHTCNCRPGLYSPVCGSDGVTYLSPCLAGCTEVSADDSTEYTFSNCQCLGKNATATNGYCPLECDRLVWYVVIFSIFVLIHSTSEVGSMLLTLRCVEPQDKALALGLIYFAIGLFGNVPCPIIYGAVVDSACLFWEENECGERGACRIYDPAKFRMYFHGITAAIMLGAFVVDVIVWYKSDSIQFHDDEDTSLPKETLTVEVSRCTQFETSV